MDIDVGTMFSNVMTAYIAGNQRSVWKSQVKSGDIKSFLERVKAKPSSWVPNTVTDVIDVKAKYEAAVRAIPEVKDFIAALFMRPRVQESYGSSLARELLSSTDKLSLNWTREFVGMPAFGYPRPHYKMTAKSGFEWSAGSDRALITHVPSLCSEWNVTIAATCALADATRWSDALLPSMEQSQLPSHPFKDQPFGSIAAFDEQLRTLYSMMALYLVQGSLLVAHANRRILERAAQLRMGIDVRSRPALVAREENVSYVFGIRMHPLISYIARSLSTGSASTYHGDKDLLYQYGRIAVNPDSAELEDIGEAVLADALSEFGRNETDTWGDCLTKTRSGSSDDGQTVSLSTLARQIRSLGQYEQRWNGLATKLGWTDLSANVGTVYQKQADFILCDGEDYTGEPAAGLLGLKPVLSLGNIRVGGRLRRTDPEFGLEADGSVGIEWSPMVVNGFQSATGSDQSYERLVIVAGMGMGEDGITIEPVDQISADPLIGQIVNHYAKNGPQGYVTQWYNPPEGEAPGFKATSWDGYAEGLTVLEAQAALVSGYKGQTVQAEKALYYSREAGRPFYHRFPVKRARLTPLKFFDPMGLWRFNMRQDGNVLFGGDISGGHSSEDIEKLVRSASTSPIGETGLPLPSDQVKEG